MIGLDEIAADLDATHRRAALDDLRHPAAMQLPAMSGSLQALGKLHAEGMAVGDLLVRRVDAADEGRGGQGRLQLAALGGGQDELHRVIGQALAGRAKLAGWRNATSLPLRRQSKPSRPSSSRQACRVRWLSNARRSRCAALRRFSEPRQAARKPSSQRHCAGSRRGRRRNGASLRSSQPSAWAGTPLSANGAT